MVNLLVRNETLSYRLHRVPTNLNYTSAAWRRARIILIIRALEGRNVWNTNGMTHPPSVGATHKKH